MPGEVISFISSANTFRKKQMCSGARRVPPVRVVPGFPTAFTDLRKDLTSVWPGPDLGGSFPEHRSSGANTRACLYPQQALDTALLIPHTVSTQGPKQDGWEPREHLQSPSRQVAACTVPQPLLPVLGTGGFSASLSGSQG